MWSTKEAAQSTGPALSYYTAIHLLPVDDFANFYARQEVVSSPPFSYSKDPDKTSFVVEISFQGQDHVRVRVKPNSGWVRVRSISLSVYDVKMKHLATHSCWVELASEIGQGRTFTSKFARKHASKLADHCRFLVEVNYYGSSLYGLSLSTFNGHYSIDVISVSTGEHADACGSELSSTWHMAVYGGI